MFGLNCVTSTGNGDVILRRTGFDAEIYFVWTNVLSIVIVNVVAIALP